MPTSMAWMSEAMGTATAVLVMGAVLGNLSIPAIIGVLIAKVSPDALFYLTFIGVITAIACCHGVSGSLSS